MLIGFMQTEKVNPTAEATTNRKANKGIFFCLPPFQTEGQRNDYDASEEHANRECFEVKSPAHRAGL